MSVLGRFSVYSVFGLDRFYCISYINKICMLYDNKRHCTHSSVMSSHRASFCLSNFPLCSVDKSSEEEATGHAKYMESRTIAVKLFISDRDFRLKSHFGTFKAAICFLGYFGDVLFGRRDPVSSTTTGQAKHMLSFTIVVIFLTSDTEYDLSPRDLSLPLIVIFPLYKLTLSNRELEYT